MTDQRIVFMGTPEFAVATLNAMVHAGLDVAAVVTAPDRPAGRGRQLRASAVKQRASELGLPVLQPEKLRSPEFLTQLDRIDAALFVVVAFRMLPEVVWNRPPLGTINLHGSLLPDYRGAAPINWAVINGERTTGVTTFRIQHEIDTGDILLQEEIPIGPNETAGELHDRMMVIGGQCVVRTVRGILAGDLTSRPQEDPAQRPLRTAPKIAPPDARLVFSNNARQVHDLIRGMSPHPGASCIWTTGGEALGQFKILRSHMTERTTDAMPGTVVIENDRAFVACSDQWIEALEVQAEGKRRMATVELIRGLRTLKGIVLK